jgi:hypothetical protein
MIVIYDPSLWCSLRSSLQTSYHSFIVLATVITIVNYDHKTFIVQDTGPLWFNSCQEFGDF